MSAFKFRVVAVGTDFAVPPARLEHGQASELYAEAAGDQTRSGMVLTLRNRARSGEIRAPGGLGPF